MTYAHTGMIQLSASVYWLAKEIEIFLLNKGYDVYIEHTSVKSTETELQVDLITRIKKNNRVK